MALDIRVTPEELRSASTNLNTKREEILAAVTNIESIIDNTVANWAGAAQSAFVEGFENMLPMLKDDFPAVIEGLAAQMTAAADAIETADAEMANALKG